MSLDYPFYEKLIRLRHPAARWWRIGDYLYYLGVLSAIGSLAGLGALIPLRFVTTAIDIVAWALRLASSFGVGVLVFFIGSFAKGHAYTLAARDHIRHE